MDGESKLPILASIGVPDDYRDRWQGILDTLSAVLNVPAALVMRAHESEVEVFSKSSNEGNVYEEGRKIKLSTGLYCETVMERRQELLIPDARKDPVWNRNPSIEQGMVSYLGLPLLWPTDDIFGSICVLDKQEKNYSETHRRLLEQFQDVIHVDLASIYREHQLKKDIQDRKLVEDALRTALKLNGLVDRMNVRELVQACLDEAERITGSRIGFLHFVNEDEKTINLVSWSTATQSHCFMPEESDRRYPVSKAGVWVDCIRKRKPVIHNNYDSLPHKKGLPDGHVPITREAIVPIVDGGKIVAIIGVGNKETDYTNLETDILSLLTKSTWVFIQRKRAEEEVRRSQELYRQLFESSRDAIMTLAPPTWKFTSANTATLKLFRLSTEAQFTELGPWDLSPERQPDGTPSSEKAAFMIETAMRDRSSFFEWMHRRKDGEDFPSTVLLTRVELDDDVFLQATVRDITGMKQSEEELTRYRDHLQDLVRERTTELAEANEERFRLATAIEQSAEIVVITTKDGTIQYVNPAFENVTGYSRIEAVGANPRILKSGKHDAEFYNNLWGTISSGGVWQGRIHNKKKDGTFFIEDATISPILDENGMITNYVAVKRDITKEVNLEAQFHQAQKMEAVGRLAGGVAHDFNNLMTIVIGYCELLKSKFDDDDSRLRVIDEVYNAGIRASNLTRQLLAFSRRQVLKPEILDLNSLISDMEKMIGRLIGEDIDLRVVHGDGIGKVNADRGQLEQIIMNLAVNARDAMPKGGKLLLETSNKIIDEGYPGNVKSGHYVMLAVTDTGFGMDENTRQKIFEPFFTTKEAGKGTGLGLSTVHGIVRQSEGYISVYSEQGKGTTFKVYLPHVEIESEVEPSSSDTSQRSVRGGETILVVEDDNSVRAVIHEMLSQAGFKTLEARDGAEALKLSREHEDSIDLLLTDVVMPGMSGRELADSLSSILKGLKILFMSGYTNGAIQHHGVLGPGSHYIEKPFTPRTLTKKVRKVLDGVDE